MITYQPRKRLFAVIDWFPHKWPVFCVGMVNGNFVLCLWLVQLEIGRSL